jgi:hypothetical protein
MMKVHEPPQWVLVDATDGRIMADATSGRLHAYATRADARHARLWRVSSRTEALKSARVVRFSVTVKP